MREKAIFLSFFSGNPIFFSGRPIFFSGTPLFFSGSSEAI